MNFNIYANLSNLNENNVIEKVINEILESVPVEKEHIISNISPNNS